MSKKIAIDFSFVDCDDNIEKYWSPTSHNYSGSYGCAEVKLATANFLSIGDVGDPDWREARRLPFGDEALDAFYPGSRGLSFIQYPGEHPDADDVDENPVTRMIANDPTFEWALREMENLDQSSDKYNQLSDLVAEIRGYNASQIEEEAFIHAPSWAMDSLIYAQERSNDPEITKIVEDFAPRKSMQGKVISTAMYPDTQSLKSISDIHDDYEIKSKNGLQQYCFALKNGRKVFGPFGATYSAIKMQRSPNRNNAGTKQFRQEQMYKVLNDIGITPVFSEDHELEYIHHLPITLDTLTLAKANYSALAEVITEANSMISFVMDHVAGLQEDIYWDKLKSYLTKARAYNDVMDWSADLNKNKVASPCLRAIGHIGLSELIDDYDKIRSEIYGRISKDYYVLTVGKNNQICITDSKEKADYFKSGSSEDLLYFLLDKKSKDKLGTLEDVYLTYGYNSTEHQEWVTSALKVLSGKYSKYSQESIQALIGQYNVNRKTKTIVSRTMREYGWLFADLPFTRKEIDILNNCLEAYGRAIVAAQQNVPAIKQLFARFKSKVEKDLIDNRIPSYAVHAISEKQMINFVYQIKDKEIPSGKEREDLISYGLISQAEIKANKYLDIELHYDYIFTNPSDVFKYVSNFAVSTSTVRAARAR